VVGAVPDDGLDDTAAIQAAIASCLSGLVKTISFPGGTLDVGSVEFPDELSVLILSGTVLRVAQDEIVTFSGPVSIGRYQVFEGDVSFPGQSEVLVDWFGARNDGTTDASTAVSRALSALGSDGNLVFGHGTYLMEETICIAASSKIIHIRGQGIDSTRIIFNPSSNKTLFSFIPEGEGQLVWRSSLRDLSIYGDGEATKNRSQSP